MQSACPSISTLAVCPAVACTDLRRVSSLPRQADMLEDEAAACHDALHYATVDWRLRRELHHRQERCEALTSKAQALAMEAQGYEADVADTTECVRLATSQLNR